MNKTLLAAAGKLSVAAALVVVGGGCTSSVELARSSSLTANSDAAQLCANGTASRLAPLAAAHEICRPLSLDGGFAGAAWASRENR